LIFPKPAHSGGFFFAAGRAFIGERDITCKMNTDLTSPAPRLLLIAAFATVYIVWGSTYLAIRIAIETLPSFLMAGFRFLVAGAALCLWLRLRGVPFPGRTQWRHAAIAGVPMIVGGNGLVVWAEKTTSSSVAALIIALTPVWFALIDWARPNGVRPRLQTLLGIVIGFSGVLLLVTGRGTNASDGGISAAGVIALAVAGICWAGGSLWSRYHQGKSESLWMNAAAQMLCGGVGLVLIALLAGEPNGFHHSRFSARSLAALAYLIVFGSWISYGAYLWLLKVSTPARVATYAYVNPVIAVILGHLVLGEPLTGRMLWAAGIILAGVIVTTWPRRERPAERGTPGRSTARAG